MTEVGSFVMISDAFSTAVYRVSGVATWPRSRVRRRGVFKVQTTPARRGRRRALARRSLKTEIMILMILTVSNHGIFFSLTV